MAERLKENKKQTAIAKLNDVPTSPRKMRLVADTVRGVEVNRALDLLKYSKKAPSIRLEKLLRSAIANWEAKNPDSAKELDNGNVYVKTIMVDEGRTLKRIRPCPQGRAGRIRKRSNHVTVVLDVKQPTTVEAYLWDRKQTLSATESVSPAVGIPIGAVVTMQRKSLRTTRFANISKTVFQRHLSPRLSSKGPSSSSPSPSRLQGRV